MWEKHHFFKCPYGTRTEKKDAELPSRKILNFPGDDFLKYLWQYRSNTLNRDRPVVSNLREERFLWHWSYIGLSPTWRKITSSNQVPKKDSQLRCQLPSHLIIKVRTFHQNHFHQIQKQTTNKARPECNRIECWIRVTRARLSKTISTLREMVSLFLITLLSLRDFGLN